MTRPSVSRLCTAALAVGLVGATLAAGVSPASAAAKPRKTVTVVDGGTLDGGTLDGGTLDGGTLD